MYTVGNGGGPVTNHGHRKAWDCPDGRYETNGCGKDRRVPAAPHDACSTCGLGGERADGRRIRRAGCDGRFRRSVAPWCGRCPRFRAGTVGGSQGRAAGSVGRGHAAQSLWGRFLFWRTASLFFSAGSGMPESEPGPVPRGRRDAKGAVRRALEIVTHDYELRAAAENWVLPSDRRLQWHRAEKEKSWPQSPFVFPNRS